jgi:YfiH family protein
VERRHLTGEVWISVSPALERLGVLTGFTERTGGRSAAPYDTLNLGFATGDEPAHVRANRERLRAAMGIPRFALARQRHGAAVQRVEVDDVGAGFDDPARAVGDADVLATSDRGVPLATLVADCLPIVIAARDDTLLATVHAGWRGLAAGVIETAAALFGPEARPAAAIGPAIGPCHYEVGEDVVKAVAAGSEGHAVVERRGGRTYLDMPRTASAVLAAAGVEPVDVSGTCTACRADRYFSHRRDGVTGRQGVVAVRL